MIRKFVPLIFLALFTSIIFANGKGDSQASEGIVEIEWLAYNTYGQPDSNSPIITAMEEKYNCEFNFWYIDDKEWEQALGVRLAAGEMPDFMKVRPVSSLKRLVDQGVVAPVTSEMFAKIPSYTEVMKEYDPESLWKIEVTVNDQIHALRKFNITGSYPTVMVWRKDWLTNVGIDKMPETLNEFEEAMYKFTFDDPDGNGKNDTYGLSETSLHYVLGAFGYYGVERFFGDGRKPQLFIKDGKYVFASVQPEMKEALALLNKWYVDGVIDPEFLTGENKGGYWAVSHSFINGRVGITGKVMATHWNPPLFEGGSPGPVLKEMLNVSPDILYGEDVIISSSPIGPEGKAGGSTWGALGEAFAFSTKATKKTAVVDTILTMINDNLIDFDQYLHVSSGIEGTHYNIDENGNYKTLEAFTKTSVATEAGIGVLNGGIGNPTFDKSKNILKYSFLDSNRNFGYLPYPTVTTDEYDRYIGDLQKLTLETYIKIILGEKELSEFDNFVKTFNANGGQAILDALN